MLLFAAFVSVLTRVLFGLGPALRSTRASVAPALKNEASMERLRGFHVRDLLVAAQVAMSVLLLVGSVLVVRSLQRALSVPLGAEIRRIAPDRVRELRELDRRQAEIFRDRRLLTPRAQSTLLKGLLRQTGIRKSMGFDQ